MMMQTRRFFPSAAGTLCSALLILGCASAPKVREVSLSAYTDEVQRAPEKASPRTLAMAGFDAWLRKGDRDAAVALWDKALAADQNEVLAIYGKLADARRRSDWAATEDTAFRLCETAPGHALCRLNIDLAFERFSNAKSPLVQEQILKRTQTLLKSDKPLDPEAAEKIRWKIFGIQVDSGDKEASEATASDLGLLNTAWLLGPFSRYANLDWNTAFWPESGKLTGSGLWGDVQPRKIQNLGSASLGIEGDHAEGHVYYWTADISLPESTDYRVLISSGAAKVFLDGDLIVDRSDYLSQVIPETSVSVVSIPAGRHRILVKTPRSERSEQVFLRISRQDGGASGLKILEPGAQSAPECSSPECKPKVLRTVPLEASAVVSELEGEFGHELASYIYAALPNSRWKDHVGARLIAEELCPDSSCTAPLYYARARTRMEDPTFSRRFSLGRSVGDLEAAVAQDPNFTAAISVLLNFSFMERQKNRTAELMDKYRKSTPEKSENLLKMEILRARVSRYADAEVESAAQRLLEASPQNCVALDTLYSLAEKNSAVSKQQEYLEAMKDCGSSVLRRRVKFLTNRGELAEAADLLSKKLIYSPQSFSAIELFSKIDVDLERWDSARSRLEEALKTWPYNVGLYANLATLLERMGDKEGSISAREKAFRLSKRDMELLQTLSLQKGQKILPDALQDGQSWIQRYREASPETDAPTTLVLDSFVAQYSEEGIGVGLIQMISRANDQNGARRIAEVDIPAGAQVLVLRTIKEDGRIIEAEPIMGKSKVSMQGVEAGDFVEAAYLLTLPASSSFLESDFSSSFFNFRDSDVRVFHSVFEVRLPKDMDGVILDSHLIPPEAIEDTVSENGRVLKVSLDNLPPLVREPRSISKFELIPWARVGRGENGEERFLLKMADSYFRYDVLTPDLRKAAAEMAAGLQGRAAVEAVYNGVMKRISGEEKLSPAAVTLLEGRGSRVNLTKALLDSLGFKTHIWAIQDNPLSELKMKLPNPQRWDMLLLSVELPEGELYLQPSLRWSIFGGFPPGKVGARAARLPGRGDEAKIVYGTLPDKTVESAEKLQVSMELDESGKLRGDGQMVYTGYNGAYMRQAFETMTSERIRQIFEQGIMTEWFKGANLLSFSMDFDEDKPDDITFRYSFEIQRFARNAGNALVIENGLLPFDLSRAWLQIFSRETPLEISADQNNYVEARLKLPKGRILETVPKDVNMETPFGKYSRRISVSGEEISINSEIHLNRRRIQPAEYLNFGGMLTSIDRLEMAPWKIIGSDQGSKSPAAPDAARSGEKGTGSQSSAEK